MVIGNLALNAAKPNVALDVKTIDVGGTVTMNGGGALTTPSCGGNYYAGGVQLTETTYGYAFSVPIACNTNTWSVKMFPGTYKVTATGAYYSDYASGSNLPPQAQVVIGNLALNAAKPNVVLDVKTIVVSGTLTLNGSAALTTPSCGGNYYAGGVSFVENTYGYAFSVPIACNTNTWSVKVFPGSYKVTATGAYYSGYASGSNLPATPEVMVDRIAF